MGDKNETPDNGAHETDTEMDAVQAFRTWKKVQSAANTASLIKCIHAHNATAKARALAKVEAEYGPVSET